MDVWPLSREGGRDGVHFVDLTMLVKDVEETIYEDDCCHVNQRGNDLIAAKLAEAMTVPLLEALMRVLGIL